MSSAKVNKAYLTNKVDQILDPMVTKVLLSNTDDHVSNLFSITKLFADPIHDGVPG